MVSCHEVRLATHMACVRVTETIMHACSRCLPAEVFAMAAAETYLVCANTVLYSALFCANIFMNFLPRYLGNVLDYALT